MSGGEVEIEHCVACGAPAHASETDDLGRCVACLARHVAFLLSPLEASAVRAGAAPRNIVAKLAERGVVKVDALGLAEYTVLGAEVRRVLRGRGG